MTSKRPWLVLICLGLFAACLGKDEAIGGDGGNVIPHGGNGQQAGGMPPDVEGGAPQIQGGGNHAGALVLGGTGGTTHVGEAGAGTNEAGASLSGGAGGAAPWSGVEQLTLCARLTQKGTHSDRLALAFDKAVFADACVGWVTKLYEVEHARPTFLNNLSDFSLELWGCEGDGVDYFGLIFAPTPLSAGDAKLLIDHYMALATDELKLSPGEIGEMHAALERLSTIVVNNPSELPSHTECLEGPGGAGGAPAQVGGASGDGGVGGAP